MNKHFISLGVIALGALTLTSCLGDNSNNEQTFTYNYGGNDCFNRVTDLETGDTYKGLSPTYTLSYRMVAGKVDVTISNLKLSADQSGIALKLPEMKFSQNKDTYFIESKDTDITPESQGTTTPPYLFDAFATSIFPGCNVYNINYLLTNTYSNKKYKVDVYGTKYKYFGDIVFSSENGETSFKSEKNEDRYLGVIINPETMKASLLANNLEVAIGKRVSFGIKDLPVTLTSNGFSISSPADQNMQLLNPNLTTEQKGRTIKNISVNATLATGATITFECNLDTDGSYRAFAPGMRYLIYNTTDKN